MRVIVLAILSGVIPFPFQATASAQSVFVNVVTAESGTPIPGAFVSLLDDHGRVLQSALTNESGSFRFQAVQPGRLQVRAEVIGRATQISPAFTLAGDEARTVPLSLRVDAILLAEIRVEPDAQCQLRPNEASQIAEVWEAARKPLAIRAWTEEMGRYRLDISIYDRDLDAAGRRIERENRRARRAVTRTPFASLPPEEVIEKGFVRQLDDGGFQYYGADANLLLSDAFLNTHCFRLTRSDEYSGMIGLAFEPVRTGRVPDIEGVLWLDEATAHLRFLDYQYTWAPYEEVRGVATGRVEFEMLPDGAWIIDRWWIRAPIAARHAELARAGDSGIRVAGIRETGGEVVGVSTLTRQRITYQERGSVTGTVWDSIRQQPLEGATVYLAGTAYAARTDSTGRFVLDSIPAGVFTAEFKHDRLDSLGIAVTGVEADVTPGSAAEIALAIPSLSTILLASCEVERDAPRTVLSGVVANRTTGAPIPGARVRVAWQEVERTRPTVAAKDHWFTVETDSEGRYTACSVPIDRAVQIRASFLKFEGDRQEIGFSEEAHQVLDLAIELPAESAVAASGAAIESGVQGVQGVLVDRQSGSPVQSAEITVQSLSGEIVANGITNERGFFRIRTPTPGRFAISTDALGYASLAGDALDVELGRLTVLEISLAPEALQLEPLVVTAEPRAFHLEMEGFYRRQSNGLGTFMTPEVFERRQPVRVTDLLFGLPGTNVADPVTGAGGRAVYFRMGEGFSGNPCWPMVYIDRHLVSTGGSASAGGEPAAVDELVPTADVMAMEVYRSAAEIPPEFNGPNAGCGVIVLWTHRGGGPR